MNTDLNTLWQRERKRREPLWTLEGLRPGAKEAKPLLTLLDEIAQLDLKSPIGDACSMSVDALGELVPETQFVGCDGYPFVIILSQHIPQPWRERFEAASPLSTRLPEGSYASVRRRFLRGWVREMQHLAAHREARMND
ncbi:MULTISPECIES: hypothetical protein [Pseudomonas]|uniref:Uncharacterized protein n=1 Tax=Pseudomonas vancouverensis TaxID=95300 RepID=A0A1H2MDH5_PSEVA|nr:MULTISPECIES: hypothetical protein [Pseudomonas]KAB0499107.1 hypothetical protein F7R09_07305 [Pseudomonas vancouverensis]TDB57803.1 hypothetical protein EIY72_26475 [Pseudomonas vancouverensis]SDU91075.1 hypothetical protein SAMN05216558_0578 [Pseudomonas vancouverensis]